MAKSKCELVRKGKAKRKGIGIELKDSYYSQAVKNLKRAESEHGIETESLF